MRAYVFGAMREKKLQLISTVAAEATRWSEEDDTHDIRSIYKVSFRLFHHHKLHVSSKRAKMRRLLVLLSITILFSGGSCQEETCSSDSCDDDSDDVLLEDTLEERLEKMKTYALSKLDDDEATSFEKKWNAYSTKCDTNEIERMMIRGEDSVANAALVVRALYTSWDTKNYPWISRTISSMVSRRANFGTWKSEQPRTMGVILQSKTALYLGDVKKAKRALSSALQYDPECKVLKDEFSKLKQYTQKIKTADRSISKGFYKRAEGNLDDAQTEMYRLGLENSKLLLADLHVRYCKVYSSMKKHERAIKSCDKAMQLSEESVQEIKKLGPDVRRKIEIHEARAIAHDKDRNYDEAVADLRAAIELTSKARMSRDKVQELETKLREAQESESKWNRLRDRDHVAVLDLPENIDEVKDLKRKCQWLKKNYRKMTVKWHPDRTKETTNEKRAGRKFDEVNKAYEVRSIQFTHS